MLPEFVQYRPNLMGPFADRFHQRSHELAREPNPEAQAEQFAAEETRWATEECKINPQQRRIYCAAWMLLRDLLRCGWSCRWSDGALELAPAAVSRSSRTPEELNQAKARMRRLMQEARREKLVEARDFVRRMESPPRNGAGLVPVRNLVASGADLAAMLRGIAGMRGSDRQMEALRTGIRPYLQLVDETARDEHTGHLLSDIWRYFRLTWITPAETTPGRTLRYLVRDAARPYHPVVGISSLENSPITITCRDDRIGWTVSAFRRMVETAADGEVVRDLFESLLRYIGDAIDDIATRGLCSDQECRQPTEEVVQRLAMEAAKSAKAHRDAVKEWASRGSTHRSDLQRSTFANTSVRAVQALYRRKRAAQLSRLLQAKLSITELLRADDFASAWRRFLESDRGRGLVRVALMAQKSRHIGTSVMEMNVCGAIPPYNELLSGKLVALLMLSPQVIGDYRSRYGSESSAIASQLKGEPVIRPAELVYMGTTSLYSVGSSQYNRLRLPAGVVSDGSAQVKWEPLGQTSGYGTFHVSAVTSRYFEEVARDAGYFSANHVFGEGASPKLRLLKKGMEVTFKGASQKTLQTLQKHAMPRLVYGAMLASNGDSYLQGTSESPEYYFNPPIDPYVATERIIDYWRARWLMSRLNCREALDRLERFCLSSILVSQAILDEMPSDSIRFAPVEEVMLTVPTASDSGYDDALEYVQNLYRGISSYSDHMDKEMLSRYHVETELDQAVYNAVAQGKSVVLTGNPGDGKTHLLRILEDRFRMLDNPPIMELDASTKKDAELLSEWREAVDQGRPFCIAINESVLFGLAKVADFEPVQRAVEEVRSAVRYDDQANSDDDVIVFDLSLRNVLSDDVVNAVIDQFTASELLSRCNSRCAGAPNCDYVRNHMLLRNPQVRRRLQLLLDRVSIAGYHFTLREVVAWVSHLLFGGCTCTQLLQRSGSLELALPQLPFSGQGRLFDALRVSLDPAQISHPVWDDMLVNAETDDADWLDEWYPERNPLDPNDQERFAARKRAFYFFHRYGEDILTMVNDDEAEFAEVLRCEDPRKTLRLIMTKIRTFFGDAQKTNAIHVWQSHRYDQQPRSILYSSSARKLSEFEIAYPRLTPSMSKAFRLASDHVLVRLKSAKSVRLRVDLQLFALLRKAERGFPVSGTNADGERHLWQFVENLTNCRSQNGHGEVTVTILDLVTHERVEVSVDTDEQKYLSITS